MRFYGLAQAVRERGQTDWLPILKRARDNIAERGGLLTIHAAFRGLKAEIDALQNAADLEKWRWLKQNWPMLIYAFSALHLLLFIVVILAARWSIKCRRLLCDPIFSRLSIYVYPCIRFWWPLQCWLLDGYVKRCAIVLRNEHEPRYIEVPLNYDGGDMAPHDVAAFWTKQRKIWIVGKSGMGKTSFCSRIERSFYLDNLPPSSRGIVNKHGFVLIFFRARDFGELQIDTKLEPDGWIIAVCQRVLARRGFPIEDKSLMRGFLRSGKVAIIIDGLGETNRAMEVIDYSQLNKETPLLVTSQSLPGADSDFALMSLPESFSEYTVPLFKLYLGQDGACRVMKEITESGLISEIRTGYDVVLIIDIAKDGDLLSQHMPDTRYKLYSNAISQMRLRDRHALFDLYGIAWEMFVTGERRVSGARFEPQLLSALLDSKVPLARRISGDMYEFRHDQMRSFLGSKYLLEAYNQIDLLIVFLKNSEIWKVRPAEQEELWTSLMAGVASCDNLGLLWLFSLEKVEYVLLQHASQIRGRELNCSWVPSLSSPAVHSDGGAA